MDPTDRRPLDPSTKAHRLPLVAVMVFALLIGAVAFAFNRSTPDQVVGDPSDFAARVSAPSPQAANGDPDGDADPTTNDGSAGTGSADHDGLEGATGFFVPGPVPEGWTIRFTSATAKPASLCPCTNQMWRHGDGSTISAHLSSEQEAPRQGSPDHDSEHVRAIPGGRVEVESGRGQAHWFDGEATRAIITDGVDLDELQTMAMSWSGDEALTPPDGFELIWSGSTPRLEQTTELYWTITDPHEQIMTVHIEPWMFDEPIDPAQMWPDSEPVLLKPNGLTVFQEPGWSEPHYVNIWPGNAWVTVTENYGEVNGHGPYLSAAEMLEITGLFRAASAAQWADYVQDQLAGDGDRFDDPADAEAELDVLLQPRLVDLQVPSR